MTISGNIDEVVASLVDFARESNAAVEAAMMQAALAVEAEAKDRCPANTGALRRSITSAVRREGGGVVGYVGTNLEYAPYVHEGTGIYARKGNGRTTNLPWVYKDDATGKFIATKGQRAQPFLEEASDAMRGKLQDYFKTIFGGG